MSGHANGITRHHDDPRAGLTLLVGPALAGNPRPCLGGFRKIWDVACAAIGMAGRIPHDLRRSRVKHYLEAGVDPHIAMLSSGHRTEAMLRRYYIGDLDDLRRAGKKASDYRGPRQVVRPLRAASTDGQRRPTAPDAAKGTKRAQAGSEAV